MSDLVSEADIDLDAQIREVARELGQREVVYPRLIATGKLRRSRAELQLAAMQAVLATLKALRETRGGPA